MAKILTGKEVAAVLRERAANLAQTLDKPPVLAIIRVGEQADDIYYENSLKKACAACGIEARVTALPLDTDQNSIEQAIKNASEDGGVSGILLFSPLPKTLDEKRIRSFIAKTKDVDCMTLPSAADVFCDQEGGFAPCTAAAAMELLKYYNIPLKGQNVVMVGRSPVVGKPLAMLMLREHATVTICHSRTVDLASIMKKADIVVAATGKARLFGADCFSKGQIVIDVGINPDPNRKDSICGDVDFEAALPIVGQITPVPGGIGSITSAVLCLHTALSAKNLV